MSGSQKDRMIELQCEIIKTLENDIEEIEGLVATIQRKFERQGRPKVKRVGRVVPLRVL